ncbi:hypothetical protein D3C74_91760 [compost metagenome]
MKTKIFKVAELSTAHIKQRTDVFLRSIANKSNDYSLAVNALDYGYLIGTDVEHLVNVQGIPKELLNILRIANQEDYSWVIFDRDTDLCEELPTWEW